MKNYFNINKTSLFIASTTIVFILINYLSIDKKNTLLITTSLYLTVLITYFLIAHKKKTYSFLNNIKVEIKNIHWPTKKDVNQTTLMVVIIILLTSMTLWIIDSLLTYIISKIM